MSQNENGLMDVSDVTLDDSTASSGSEGLPPPDASVQHFILVSTSSGATRLIRGNGSTPPTGRGMTQQNTPSRTGNQSNPATPGNTASRSGGGQLNASSPGNASSGSGGGQLNASSPGNASSGSGGGLDSINQPQDVLNMSAGGASPGGMSSGGQAPQTPRSGLFDVTLPDDVANTSTGGEDHLMSFSSPGPRMGNSSNSPGSQNLMSSPGQGTNGTGSGVSGGPSIPQFELVSTTSGATRLMNNTTPGRGNRNNAATPGPLNDVGTPDGFRSAPSPGGTVPSPRQMANYPPGSVPSPSLMGFSTPAPGIANASPGSPTLMDSSIPGPGARNNPSASPNLMGFSTPAPGVGNNSPGSPTLLDSSSPGPGFRNSPSGAVGSPDLRTFSSPGPVVANNPSGAAGSPNLMNFSPGPGIGNNTSSGSQNLMTFSPGPSNNGGGSGVSGGGPSIPRFELVSTTSGANRLMNNGGTRGNPNASSGGSRNAPSSQGMANSAGRAMPNIPSRSGGNANVSQQVMGNSASRSGGNSNMAQQGMGNNASGSGGNSNMAQQGMGNNASGSGGNSNMAQQGMGNNASGSGGNSNMAQPGMGNNPVGSGGNPNMSQQVFENNISSGSQNLMTFSPGSSNNGGGSGVSGGGASIPRFELVSTSSGANRLMNNTGTRGNPNASSGGSRNAPSSQGMANSAGRAMPNIQSKSGGNANGAQQGIGSNPSRSGGNANGAQQGLGSNPSRSGGNANVAQQGIGNNGSGGNASARSGVNVNMSPSTGGRSAGGTGNNPPGSRGNMASSSPGQSNNVAGSQGGPSIIQFQLASTSSNAAKLVNNTTPNRGNQNISGGLTALTTPELVSSPEGSLNASPMSRTNNNSTPQRRNPNNSASPEPLENMTMPQLISSPDGNFKPSPMSRMDNNSTPQGRTLNNSASPEGLDNMAMPQLISSPDGGLNASPMSRTNNNSTPQRRNPNNSASPEPLENMTMPQLISSPDGNQDMSGYLGPCVNLQGASQGHPSSAVKNASNSAGMANNNMPNGGRSMNGSGTPGPNGNMQGSSQASVINKGSNSGRMAPQGMTNNNNVQNAGQSMNGSGPGGMPGQNGNVQGSSQGAPSAIKFQLASTSSNANRLTNNASPGRGNVNNSSGAGRSPNLIGFSTPAPGIGNNAPGSPTLMDSSIPGPGTRNQPSASPNLIGFSTPAPGIGNNSPGYAGAKTLLDSSSPGPGFRNTPSGAVGSPNVQTFSSPAPLNNNAPSGTVGSQNPRNFSPGPGMGNNIPSGSPNLMNFSPGQGHNGGHNGAGGGPSIPNFQLVSTSSGANKLVGHTTPARGIHNNAQISGQSGGVLNASLPSNVGNASSNFDDASPLRIANVSGRSGGLEAVSPQFNNISSSSEEGSPQGNRNVPNFGRNMHPAGGNVGSDGAPSIPHFSLAAMSSNAHRLVNNSSPGRGMGNNGLMDMSLPGSVANRSSGSGAMSIALGPMSPMTPKSGLMDMSLPESVGNRSSGNSSSFNGGGTMNASPRGGPHLSLNQSGGSAMGPSHQANGNVPVPPYRAPVTGNRSYEREGGHQPHGEHSLGNNHPMDPNWQNQWDWEANQRRIAQESFDREFGAMSSGSEGTGSYGGGSAVGAYESALEYLHEQGIQVPLNQSTGAPDVEEVMNLSGILRQYNQYGNDSQNNNSNFSGNHSALQGISNSPQFNRQGMDSENPYHSVDESMMRSPGQLNSSERGYGHEQMPPFSPREIQRHLGQPNNDSLSGETTQLMGEMEMPVWNFGASPDISGAYQGAPGSSFGSPRGNESGGGNDSYGSHASAGSPLPRIGMNRSMGPPPTNDYNPISPQQNRQMNQTGGRSPFNNAPLDGNPPQHSNRGRDDGTYNVGGRSVGNGMQGGFGNGGVVSTISNMIRGRTDNLLRSEGTSNETVPWTVLRLSALMTTNYLAPLIQELIPLISKMLAKKLGPDFPRNLSLMDKERLETREGTLVVSVGGPSRDAGTTTRRHPRDENQSSSSKRPEFPDSCIATCPCQTKNKSDN